MRAVVVYCHPVEGSFCSAMRDAALRGLTAAGHEVALIDLAAEQFNPVMSRDEWNAYFNTVPMVSDDVQNHVNLVRGAEILVFVYPTWWSSTPAQLKGWVERVFLPTVAFRLNEQRKVRPGLRNLRHICTVSTFGSPWLYVKVMNDNGARIFHRALRWAAIKQPKRTRLALYRMDKSTDQSRRAFLTRIEEKMRTL